MKKTVLIFVTFHLYLNVLLAQSPSWTVNESDYQYTMTFLTKLNLNGKQLIGSTDKVGAFVGNTCRGISGLTYVKSKDTYYAYLTVFSNTDNESIYFKLYDGSNDKITNVSKQVLFKRDEHYGTLFQSYSIAEPTLNDKAELISFNFLNVTSVSSNINNRNVNIVLYNSFDLTSLSPIFTLSEGGKLFKKRIEQVSGKTIDDFSSEITYEVLSQDESTLTEYVVSVNQIEAPTKFYKKDAVCNVGGAIKVVSNQEGNAVTITSNGVTILEKKIINGEVIFTNLNTGSYIISVGNEQKIINIILKTK
jgi:hypothetical protein